MNQEDFAIAVSKAFEGGFVKFISATCLVGGLIPAELSAGLVEPLPVAHISRHPAGGVGVVGLLQHAHCISTVSIDPLILVDCVTCHLSGHSQHPVGSAPSPPSTSAATPVSLSRIINLCLPHI